MAEPPVYFAFTGGRQIGPLHFAELADLAARGVLQPEDLAWKSGTPEWVPASQLLAFPKPKLAPAPLEMPALQQPGPDDVGVPPAPAVSTSARAAGPVPAPGKWPRVKMTKGSDDPGLSLEETGAKKAAGDDALAEAEEAPSQAPSRLAALLPFRRLNDAAVLGSPVTWSLVFFGVGPLLVSAVAEDPLLRIRLFDFGCGALWVAFFYWAYRTETATTRTILAVFFGSVLFSLLYFGLLEGWPPISALQAASSDAGLATRFLASLAGTALVQELGKVALFILIARALGELNGSGDGLFFGLIAGAGFGLCASIVRSSSLGLAGEKLLRGATETPVAALYAAFLGAAVQTLTFPFLHAVWSAIAGSFVVGGFPSRGRPAAPGRIVLGLALAVVLHALYEALTPPATAFFSVLVAAAALALFLALRRDAEERLAVTEIH
ncbi:MAG: GYF domain-containing protein [Thermoanaerobaculia bacterium]